MDTVTVVQGGEAVRNPATAMLAGLLSTLVAEVRGLRATLERRETRSPGIFRITPAGSVAGEGQRRIDPQLRVMYWILSVSAAGAYGVRVGSHQVITIQVAAADTLIIPLLDTLLTGNDITTTGTAANIVDSLLVAYSD